MIKLKYLCFSIFTLAFITVSFDSAAQKLRIAVAANAQGVIKKLQADFRKRTGIETEAITGASGKLTAQIMNGAPYEVFLSADNEFPQKLYSEGLGVAKPKIYALGSLIVCGFAGGDFKKWQIMLATEGVKTIAIANPKTAPYGKAAAEALKYYGLENKVNKKLVFGESIAQVNNYLQTKVADVAFTTESFLYEKTGKPGFQWARVDAKSYNVIEQGVILLKSSEKSGNSNAKRFYDYLSSASARKIISNNGYHLPK